MDEQSVAIEQIPNDSSRRGRRPKNTATWRASAKANKTVQSPLKGFPTVFEKTTGTKSGAIFKPTQTIGYVNHFPAASLAESTPTINTLMPSATTIPPMKISRPTPPTSSKRVFIATGVVFGIVIFFFIGIAFLRKGSKRRRIFRISASSWIGDYNVDGDATRAVTPETQNKFDHLDQEKSLQSEKKSNEAKVQRPDTAKSINSSSLEDTESVLDPSLERPGPLAQERKSGKTESDVSVNIPPLQYPTSVFNPSSSEIFHTPNSTTIYDNSYLYSSVLLPFEKESEFSLLSLQDELKKVGSQDQEITIPVIDEPVHRTLSQHNQSPNREKYIYSDSNTDSASICL